MSALVVILIVLGAVLLLFLVGGFLASRRRLRLLGSDYARHVAHADQALEAARAADKGWDRQALERVARDALARERPGWTYEELHLVLVDDAPGVTEDRAHYLAVGRQGQARLILTRRETGWTLAGID